MLDRPLRETVALMHERICRGRYMGVVALKCPLDWWSYIGIVHETRPDVIVEVGNHSGGALLAFAHLCDTLGRGVVVGVDRRKDLLAPEVLAHPRIRIVTGEATAVLPEVRGIVGDRRAMVVEDSSHTYDNTLAVLRGYGPLVAPGCYLIVEDGIYGHGVEPKGGAPAGAFEAVDAFLAESPAFERDPSCEWPITWNPGGYLRRTR